MGDSVYFHWVQDPAVVQYEGELLEVVLENVEKPVLVERHATAAEFALKAAITADLVWDVALAPKAAPEGEGTRSRSAPHLDP